MATQSGKGGSGGSGKGTGGSGSGSKGPSKPAGGREQANTTIPTRTTEVGQTRPVNPPKKGK